MSSDMLTISEADVDRIADRVVQKIRRVAAVDSDWLTREQAEAYLNFSRTAFYEARCEHPEALKPCCESPLRWSRDALDIFKATLGAPLPARRGPKRKAAL